MMNKFLILTNITIHFVFNSLFISYSYSNSNIEPLKTKSFNIGKFDYHTLEKVKISNNFPKYRITSEESCRSNKGNK